jgi:hypothetical protein
VRRTKKDIDTQGYGMILRLQETLDR